MGQIVSESHLIKRGDVYYTDIILGNGKRVRRSTGQKTQSLARARLSEIVAELEAQEAAPAVAFGDYARGFFAPGSSWMARREAQGHIIKEITRRAYERCLDDHIMGQYQDRDINTIKGPEVERWALTLTKTTPSGKTGNIGASYKNEIMRTMRIVIDEAIRDEIRTAPFAPERFAKDSKRKDILTDDELARLFPEDKRELAEIWRTDYLFEPPLSGLMFGTMFLAMVSAGLRPGEVRALEPRHLFLDQGAIAVTQAIDHAGDVDLPKKGKATDPRFRVVMIPDRTVQVLREWMAHQTGAFVFEFAGKVCGPSLLKKRFSNALKRAKIPEAGRTLTPHSCRYTYNTKMEMMVSGDILRSMIGHRDEAMTAHYSRPVIEDRIKQLQGQRVNLESFWK